MKVSKWNSSPKNENLLSLRPSKMQIFVCLFRTDLEKFSITSLAHRWILCSEWLPSEWESKQLLNASQRSTSNPHDSISSINVLWSEKLCVFKFKPLLMAKYEFSIYKNAFSSENVVSSESEEKYANIKHCLQAKTVKNAKQTCWWIFMWGDSRGWTFLLEEALLWIMDRYFCLKWI